MVSSGMGGGCGAVVAPATTMVARQVWVPNVITEEVDSVENTTRQDEVAYTVYEQQTTQVPVECTFLVYRPESRTSTRKVVDYVTESRPRTRKVVKYSDEKRTRTRKELTYRQETKTETYPVVTYRSEKRSKEVTFTYNVPEVVAEPYTTTRYEQVAEEKVEQYTVKIPVCTMKEVQVQVIKMVPRVVTETVNICGASSAAGVSMGAGSMVIDGGMGGCGAASSGAAAGGCGCGVAAPAPVAAPCGCK
jgi:hypothetical protein